MSAADAARPSVLCANAAGQGDATTQQRQQQQPLHRQQQHQEAAGTGSVVMPFVVRKVEPRHLCRGHVPAGSQGWPVGAELEAVANGALTGSLKQLASLLTAAEDIFACLTVELAYVAGRSGDLRRRIDKVEERLSKTDPKKIPVREYLSQQHPAFTRNHVAVTDLIFGRRPRSYLSARARSLARWRLSVPANC